MEVARLLQGLLPLVLDASQREYVPLSKLDSYSSSFVSLEEVQISRSSFDTLPPGLYTIRARTLVGGVSEGSVLVEPGQQKIKTIVPD